MKTHQNHLVSICIPTYNRSNKLKKTLESAVKQDYTNIEIIVSDNNSSDDTHKVVSSFKDNRIKYHKNTINIGMQGNFNKCADIAKGKFFILLSDDDLLKKNMVSELLECIESNPMIAFAYSKVHFIKGDKITDKHSQIAPNLETGMEFIEYNLQDMRAAFPSATIIRLEKIKANDGYPDILNATDFGLLLEICLEKNCLVSFINKPLVNYCIHDGNLSTSSSHIKSLDVLIDWIKVVLTDHNYLLDKALRKYRKDLMSTYRSNKRKKNKGLMIKSRNVYNKYFNNTSDKFRFFLLTNSLFMFLYDTLTYFLKND
jgi:glycosyltransferase involved in cell wall biosynthesis